MSDIGLNIRSTSGYVTDPANTTYFLPISDGYPTTRGGFTFGVITSEDGRDRNAGVDPRLAGTGLFPAVPAKSECRLDLPAGSYDIQLDCGDFSYARAVVVKEVLDDATSRFTINGATTGANRWLDALGAQHDTTWVPSSAEANTNQSISSGILRFKTGDGISAFTGFLAHIRATSVAGGGGAGSRPTNVYRGGKKRSPIYGNFGTS